MMQKQSVTIFAYFGNLLTVLTSFCKEGLDRGFRLTALLPHHFYANFPLILRDYVKY
jgi:hypothetical protein